MHIHCTCTYNICTLLYMLDVVCHVVQMYIHHTCTCRIATTSGTLLKISSTSSPFPPTPSSPTSSIVSWTWWILRSPRPLRQNSQNLSSELASSENHLRENPPPSSVWKLNTVSSCCLWKGCSQKQSTRSTPKRSNTKNCKIVTMRAAPRTPL